MNEFSSSSADHKPPLEKPAHLIIAKTAKIGKIDKISKCGQNIHYVPKMAKKIDKKVKSGQNRQNWSKIFKIAKNLQKLGFF